MKLTVLVGPPGAGKSTWVSANVTDEYVATTHPVRTNKQLDVGSYMEWMRGAAIRQLAQGRDVVIDATNTYPHHRLPWRTVASKAGAMTRAIAFDTGLPLLIRAQRTRQHPAPDPVVRRHYALMRAALRQLPTEGWDELIVVRRR